MKINRSFRVIVDAGSANIKRRQSDIICKVDRDIKINTQALESFCFKALSNLDVDLVLLTASVAFSDRAIKRRADHWKRDIELVLPVTNIDSWNRKEVIDALSNALNYLTGDSWRFSFYKSKPLSIAFRQEHFALAKGDYAIIPYSDGLDSFCQSKLLKLTHPNLELIRLTVRNRSINGDAKWCYDPDGSKHRRVSIPFSIKTNHPEQTYRTRTFVFSVLCALACRLSNSQLVYVPENGQGSIGPSLIPCGQESPLRGSHPRFTKLVSNFFNALSGVFIQFEHSQLWQTKGQVISLLKKEKLISGWEKTTSCARDRRHVNAGGRAIQCGVCAGCLLRRVSLSAAGIMENPSTYLWGDLTKASLEESLHPAATRRTNANDEKIAISALIAMNDFAMLSKDDANVSGAIRSAAAEICDYDKLSLASTVANLQTLLLNHKKEWNTFTFSLGKASWINNLASLYDQAN